MEKIYRAAKYIRTSFSDNELQDRNSITNQNKLIDDFLRMHPEIVIVTENIDEGCSGVFFDRPAFNKMVTNIKEGYVDCVVVKDLSRLGRNYIETGKCIRDLFLANDVRFISVDDSIDSILMDEFDKTIILIKSIFSEQYSCDVSIKTRSSLAAKRRQGKYVGAVPIYGYQKSDEDKYKLELDQNTFTVVQTIFNMKLRGMSAAGIATKLNNLKILSPLAYKQKQRIPHPTGGFADKHNSRWSATTISRILKDENYTGTLVQGRQHKPNYKSKTILNLGENKWAKTENAHPYIISKMDYDAVQRVLALDTRTAPKHNEVHIFSGLLICGCCGGNITRKTVKKYIYYYCPTGKSNGCHLSFVLSEKDLLQLVAKQIEERIVDIQKLTHFLSTIQIEELMKKGYVQQIAKYSQNIHELQKYKIHLHDSLTRSIIDEVEFLTFQNYYDREIARLSVEIIALQKKNHHTKETLKSEFAWMNNFLQFIDLTELDRSAVVKMIQKIQVLNKNEITVDFVCRCEYEQVIRYLTSGGYGYGEKEPQAE